MSRLRSHGRSITNPRVKSCPRNGVHHRGLQYRRGKENSCSIREAISIVEGLSGRPQGYDYAKQYRNGDHICYFSDLRKTRAHYPGWRIAKSFERVIGEMVESYRQRDRPSRISE
jgi:hypothetical protein